MLTFWDAENFAYSLPSTFYIFLLINEYNPIHYHHNVNICTHSVFVGQEKTAGMIPQHETEQP